MFITLKDANIEYIWRR